MILERLIKMPVLGIDGIITQVKNESDNTKLIVTVRELAWHLNRRIFTHSNSQEFEFTNLSISDAVGRVITSANNDMPFDWIKGDIVSGNVNIKGKYKYHLDVLEMIAHESGNDLWFENHLIHIGKRGKTIDVSKDNYFFDLLGGDINLDKYANKVTLVKKDGDVITQATASDMETNLEYTYEKVVVNNNVTGGQDEVQEGANRLLKDCLLYTSPSPRD